ncbi:hypothetical protein KKB43_04545 [Patescibacteria group bacterium]|nr:hypothetical protein [Patescibacteria group bacterium]MBU4580257.1 hypothetical protein [Patescibacteria group bacterium]
MAEIINSQILLYQTEDGEAKIEVKLQGETVWLVKQQKSPAFAELFTDLNIVQDPRLSPTISISDLNALSRADSG